MHVDLHVAVGLLDAADDVVGRLRLQQRSHVLQRQRLRTHVEQLAGEVHVALDGVQRRDGVADRALGVLAGLLDRLHRVRHVARIVQRVEDTEDIHAVLGGLVHEPVDDLVVVVAVAEQVLATQQHLQARVRHQFAEGPQPHPGILIEVSNTRIVGSATPALDAPVAGLVNVLASLDHVFECHTDRNEALVSVAEGDLGNTNGSLTHGSHPPIPTTTPRRIGPFRTGVRQTVSGVRNIAARAARSAVSRPCGCAAAACPARLRRARGRPSCRSSRPPSAGRRQRRAGRPATTPPPSPG